MFNSIALPGLGLPFLCLSPEELTVFLFYQSPLAPTDDVFLLRPSPVVAHTNKYSNMFLHACLFFCRRPQPTFCSYAPHGHRHFALFHACPQHKYIKKQTENSKHVLFSMRELTQSAINCAVRRACVCAYSSQSPAMAKLPNSDQFGSTRPAKMFSARCFFLTGPKVTTYTVSSPLP